MALITFDYIAIAASYFKFSCAGVGAWKEYGEKL